jgi:pectate lyase
MNCSSNDLRTGFFSAVFFGFATLNLFSVSYSWPQSVARPNLEPSEFFEPSKFLENARAGTLGAMKSCFADPRTLVAKITGAASGTTGGLGKPIVTVTSPADGRISKSDPTSVGTLRWAVDQARRSGGAWIVFDPALKGQTIRLESSLRLPSNVTLDGGCAGIEIVSPAPITQLRITDAENIIITGLSFSKHEYDERSDKTGDAIGVDNQFDRLAILHNNFRRCGDGCIDIVRKERFETQSRATIAFNRFSQHNKVMLIGTLACYADRSLPGCGTPLQRLNEELTPRVFVTVAANVFDQTSQRHPKVVSNAMVHLVNNIFSFAPTIYSNNSKSAVYGAATGTGGVLIAESNIFINDDTSSQIGAGSIRSIRSAGGGGREPDGVVAAENNITIGAIRVVENEAALARELAMPDLPKMPAVTLSANNVRQMAACLYRIAGPFSSAVDWPATCAE